MQLQQLPDLNYNVCTQIKYTGKIEYASIAIR